MNADSLVKIVAALLPILSLQGCLTGCSAEYWTGKTTIETRLVGPGWEFRDTKDNDIILKGAKYDPATHVFNIDELTVKNNASLPITAEVERIRAIGEAQMSQVAYLTATVQGLANIISAAGGAAPGFSFLAPQAGGGKSLSIPSPLGNITLGSGGTTAWVAPNTVSAADQAKQNAAQLEAAKAQNEFNARIIALLEKLQPPPPPPASQPVSDANQEMLP